MRAVIATLSLALLSTLAHADAGCDAKAAEKKLAGAAKSSFLKKCEKDAGGAAGAACAAKAVDKNGKALAGAAKASSIKKCEKEAAAAK
jgi:hypothetical protein